ncbi:unnamed protein product [Orchesella dallaii]|uniref:Uncharacterized protein n=1 Tax=Orchesella dallaii TaxID=48710 RepID=A0ABP1QIT2_9HEXA
MKLFAKAISGMGADKDKTQSTIDIPQTDEDEKIERKFSFLWYILLILGFWVCIQALVAFGIANEAGNEIVAVPSDVSRNHIKTTDHAAIFSTVNFTPAGKPDNEFWNSIKPTVQFDKEKLSAKACREENGQGNCGSKLQGEAAGRNCTIYSFLIKSDVTNQGGPSENLMELLNNTICNIVAYVDKELEAPRPSNPRVTFVTLETEEEKLENQRFEWIDEMEINYVDKNIIAYMEATVGRFNRMGELKFHLQLEEMQEEIAERILNVFEQAQWKGLRLYKANFSCNGVDKDDCVVEYSFVNANHLWEYISVVKEDKGEGAQKDVETIDHVGNFLTPNFQPAGKPNKEFWNSLKPTVQIDRTKLYNRCRVENGRAYCLIPLHGKGVNDPRHCTILTLMSDVANQKESAAFKLEMKDLKNMTCDVVVSLGFMPLDLRPLTEPFIILAAGASDEAKEAFLAAKGWKWYGIVRIGGLNENSIAYLESQIEQVTRTEQMKIKLQLEIMEGMVKGLSNMFEQAPDKVLRLVGIDSSCHEVDNSYCLVVYSFVNANYFWEYINVVKEDKGEGMSSNPVII